MDDVKIPYLISNRLKNEFVEEGNVLLNVLASVWSLKFKDWMHSAVAVHEVGDLAYSGIPVIDKITILNETKPYLILESMAVKHSSDFSFFKERGFVHSDAYFGFASQGAFKKNIKTLSDINEELAVAHDFLMRYHCYTCHRPVQRTLARTALMF